MNNQDMFCTLALASFLAAPGVFAQVVERSNPVNDGKPIEWRTHYEARDPKSGVAYKMTEITQLPNETEDRHYTLVEDAASRERLIVKYSMNFFDHEVVVEVTDLDTRETASASSPVPYKSITRSGALDEIHKNPVLRNWRVPSITVNVNGVKETASEGEWLSKSIRDKRSALRKAASPQFLERLERLRSVGTPDSPLFPVCSNILLYLLYNETCKTPDVHTENAQPDCAFDSSFRFDCSQKSKDRIAKAKENGEKIERY